MAQPEDLAAVSARRFAGPEWFLVVGLALVAALGVLVIFRPELIERLDALFQSWRVLAIDYGLIGVFLAMLVGNLTIMVIMPSTVVPFLVAAAGVNPIAVGVASGLGALLGEYSGYLLGVLGSGAALRRYPDAYEIVQRIVGRRPKIVWLMLFLFSLLPLPDDVLFIPLGIIRYGWWKLFLPALAGKLMAGWFIAYGGHVSGALVEPQRLTLESLLGQIGLLAFLVAFTYGLLRIPWNAVLKRFDR